MTIYRLKEGGVRDLPEQRGPYLVKILKEISTLEIHEDKEEKSSWPPESVWYSKLGNPILPV